MAEAIVTHQHRRDPEGGWSSVYAKLNEVLARHKGIGVWNIYAGGFTGLCSAGRAWLQASISGCC